jgi:nicotinic acid mononucleotide adenylyltransferase
MSDTPLPDSPLERFLQTGENLHVAADGQMLFASSGRCPPPRVVLPGSFNPMHHGHWQLAAIAAQIVGHPVAFEISAVNVDKPPLTSAEIRRRLAPFNWQAPVWLTNAPRFVQKAACFPDATFVIGADTALRLVSPRYYDDDVGQMHSALTQIRACGCHFLVACRADAQGQYWRLADVPIPADFSELFAEIAPEIFRMDVSSTELRLKD